MQDLAALDAFARQNSLNARAGVAAKAFASIRRSRDPRQRLLPLEVIARGIVQGLLAAAVPMAVYLVSDRDGLRSARLRTLTFFALVVAILALVVAILALVLANRSFSASLFPALVRGNLAFRYVLALIAASPNPGASASG